MKKNHFKSSLITLFVALLIVSCSKTSDPTPTNQVVGNWKISAYLVKENNDPEQDAYPLLVAFGGKCITELVYAFKADGTVSTSIPTGCSTSSLDLTTSGKWAVSGSKLTLTDNTGVKDEYDYTVSASELTLSVTEQSTDPTTKKVTTTKSTLKFKKV